MFDSYFDGCATRPEQELTHFRIGLPSHRVAIDGENPIAITQAGAPGWRLREGGANVSINVFPLTKIFDRGADSHVLGALLGAERGVFDWIEIGRVWIQHAQHAADRRLENVVIVQFPAVNVV